MDLHPDIKAQADAITIDPTRPLILTDADEVIVQLASCLEVFLHENDLYFDMASFALVGNIKRKHDDMAVTAEEVTALMGQFFLEKTETQPPIPGAPEALKALSARAQIIVVTNVPQQQREARVRGLTGHGMGYPLIANIGLKGKIIKYLADQVEAPVYFLDDLPHNISSVAKEATQVHCIHFIGDERLAKLLGPAEDSHHRSDNWPDTQAYIEAHLTDAGH